MIRIIGLPRSGTTWAEYLVEKNLACGVTHYAKHQLPSQVQNNEFEQGKCRYTLLVRKRLDHWLGSAVRAKGIIGRQHYGIPQNNDTLEVDLYTLAELHGMFYDQWEHWLRQHDARYELVEYDELLWAPEVRMADIAQEAEVAIANPFDCGPALKHEKFEYYCGVGPWGETPYKEIGQVAG